VALSRTHIDILAQESTNDAFIYLPPSIPVLNLSNLLQTEAERQRVSADEEELFCATEHASSAQSLLFILIIDQQRQKCPSANPTLHMLGCCPAQSRLEL